MNQKDRNIFIGDRVKYNDQRDDRKVLLGQCARVLQVFPDYLFVQFDDGTRLTLVKAYLELVIEPSPELRIAKLEAQVSQILAIQQQK